MNKKAQSEVITTVLIILLVLAAVFIVYTAVRNMIQGGTSQATDKTKCLEISLNPVYANATSDSVTVTRASGGDDTDVSDLKVIVDGSIASINETLSPASGRSMVVLSTKTIYLSSGLNAGQNVQVAPVLSSGYKCDSSTTTIKAV